MEEGTPDKATAEPGGTVSNFDDKKDFSQEIYSLLFTSYHTPHRRHSSPSPGAEGWTEKVAVTQASKTSWRIAR
jgi:hypothetical protein